MECAQAIKREGNSLAADGYCYSRGQTRSIRFCGVDALGDHHVLDDVLDKHIQAIIDLGFVDAMPSPKLVSG